MNQVSAPEDSRDAESVPILFHDGCPVCLDIARTLTHTIPGLAIIDLARLQQFRKEAVERGIERLPSLMVRGKVLPVAPGSGGDHY